MKQIKQSFLYLLFAGCLCLYSCEYVLDETNISNIEQPSGEPAFRLIPKAQTLQDGTVLINYSSLFFTLENPGVPFVDLYGDGIYTFVRPEVYIDGVLHSTLNPYQANENEVKYYLLDHRISNGIHDLKVYVKTFSDVGSIASKAGAEFQEKTFNWKINVDIKPTEIIINHRIMDDGRIEFYWNKPDSYYGTLKHFRVYTNDYAASQNSFNTTETSYVFRSSDIYYCYISIEAFFEESFLQSRFVCLL